MKNTNCVSYNSENYSNRTITYIYPSKNNKYLKDFSMQAFEEGKIIRSKSQISRKYF